MSTKRKDNKGGTLRNGERRTVYSWKPVETDKLKDGQRGQKSLREKEKGILKDLDDHIRTKMT